MIHCAYDDLKLSDTPPRPWILGGPFSAESTCISLINVEALTQLLYGSRISQRFLFIFPCSLAPSQTFARGDRLKTLSTILRLSKPYAKSASMCNVVTLVSLIQNDLDKTKHGSQKNMGRFHYLSDCSTTKALYKCHTN